MDCYSEPLLFVEVSETQPWRILHMNDGAVSTTGDAGSCMLSIACVWAGR